MMRLIREAEQIRMPWKNGGGETIEIARGPEGYSLDTFEWRVSRARVDGDGAFSRFDDIDRTLSVLDGDGISLTLGEGEEICLRQQSQPFLFDGGLPVYSRLLNGPIMDLNVMTRRGRFVHRVDKLSAASQIPVSGVDKSLVLVLSAGSATFETADTHGGLKANDVVLLAPNDAAIIRPESLCRIYLIEIRPV